MPFQCFPEAPPVCIGCIQYCRMQPAGNGYGNKFPVGPIKSYEVRIRREFLKVVCIIFARCNFKWNLVHW